MRTIVPEEPWLLVFDNVLERKDIQRYIPPVARNGSVLITTQSKAVGGYSKKSSHITGFDEDEGARILLNYLHESVDSIDRPDDHDSELLESAKQVCRLVGGLPLALAHVGGCLHESTEDLKAFLAQFSEELHAVWEDSTEALGPYERTLATVFDRALKDLDGTIRKILDIMVFLNPDAIHEDMLFRHHQNEYLASIGPLPKR